MKRVITLLLALLISASAFAGNNKSLPFISFGLKGGFTSNQQKFDVNVITSSAEWKKNASGFNLGAVARVDFPLIPIYVQGELVYDWGKFNNVNIANLISTNTNVTMNTLSVPVLLGVGIGSTSFIKIRANAGPVFNLVSSAKLSGFNDVNLEHMFSKQTVTWTAGLGIDLFRIMVDVRYNGVFKKNKISNASDMLSVNTRPTSWTFTVGYLF